MNHSLFVNSYEFVNFEIVIIQEYEIKVISKNRFFMDKPK